MERRKPLDLDAIRRDFPLPSVVGAVVPLKRAGSELKGCCPFHGEKTPSFTVYDGGKRFHCFGCGASGDVLDFVGRLNGVGLREAADMLTGGTIGTIGPIALPPAADGADRTGEALEIWNAAQPISGTLAEAYLRSRGLHLPLPDCLRFAVLPYGKRGRQYPCMVAAVTGLGDALVGIQRTYLRDDGTGKADLSPARLSLGRLTSGAVRLTPPARTLILTEGTEDALSLIQSGGRAAWAALGTSNLARVDLPLMTDDVVIGADGDPAGEAAALKAANAYAERGCRVRIIRPMPGFKDFNSELQEAH